MRADSARDVAKACCKRISKSGQPDAQPKLNGWTDGIDVAGIRLGSRVELVLQSRHPIHGNSILQTRCDDLGRRNSFRIMGDWHWQCRGFGQRVDREFTAPRQRAALTRLFNRGHARQQDKESRKQCRLTCKGDSFQTSGRMEAKALVDCISSAKPCKDAQTQCKC